MIRERKSIFDCALGVAPRPFYCLTNSPFADTIVKSISTARPNFSPKSQNRCHVSLQDWWAQHLGRPMFGQVPKARAFPPRKMESLPTTHAGNISQIQQRMIPGWYSASLNGYPENYYLPIVFLSTRAAASIP
jgi:hypothetical protein